MKASGCLLTLYAILSCSYWNFVSSLKVLNNNAQIPGQKLSSEEIAKLEMKQFELERDEFVRELQKEQFSSSGRVKRTVIYNSEAPLDVVFLWAIPLTILLPVLSNVFNDLNWGKIFKGKRSIPDKEYEEDHSLIQPHVDKISGYFELLKIPEKGCQERAICEFSAEPSRYYPVSELVLQRIRNPLLPPMGYSEGETYTSSVTTNGFLNGTSRNQPSRTKPKTLFRTYTEAADKGLVFGQEICATDFMQRCPNSIEEKLNMPALQFWGLLSSLLKFNIRDNV